MEELFEKIKNKLTSKEGKKLILTYANFLSPLITVPLLVLLEVKLNNTIPILPFTFFSLVVFAHASVGGLVPGVLSALLLTLAGNYFFFPPYESFKVDLPSITASVFFLIQSLVIAFITGRFFLISRFLGKKNQELIYSAERLNQIIDGVFAIIVIIDKSGRILESNQAFESIVKKENSTFRRNIFNSSPWAYSKDANTNLRNAIRKVKLYVPVKYDERIKISENQFLDVEMNITEIETDQNSELIVITALDITSRKLYEGELIKGRENYTKLINSNIIGMVIGNSSGEIFEFNRSFIRLLGYTEEEFIAESIGFDRLMPPNSEITNILETSIENPKDIDILSKEGRRIPVMLSGVSLNESNDEFLRLIVDISSQKELERKKDEFISIASHELKTPLTTLKGYTQVLQESLNKRYQEHINYTNTIDNQLDKLNTLINELLDITKIQAGKLSLNLERLNIVNIANDALEDIRPFLDDHKIIFNYQSPAIFVEGDRFRLGQVITNFLTNAIKYSANGTEIKVTAEISSNKARISVEDQGIGIPKESVQKVFDKFFQSENYSPENIEGLGLGLYISSEIIKQHKGEIGVNSILNKGSTFFFELPLN